MAASLYFQPAWRLLRLQAQPSIASPLQHLHFHHRQAQLRYRSNHSNRRHCNQTRTASNRIAVTATSWARRAGLGVPIEVTTRPGRSSGRTTGLVVVGAGAAVEAEVEAEAVVRRPVCGQLNHLARRMRSLARLSFSWGDRLWEGQLRCPTCSRHA